LPTEDEVKGQTATGEEIKARWAYSELTSPRFGPGYVGHGPVHLFEMAKRGEPFSEVSPADWDILRDMLIQRRGSMPATLDHAATYKCQGWRRSQLLSVRALPSFNPLGNGQAIPYRNFLDGAPTAGNDDPRTVFAAITLPAKYEQAEPVVIVRVCNEFLLLEGYLRSLLFAKSIDPDAELLVWVPC
jgi:hypothetical protein